MTTALPDTAIAPECASFARLFFAWKGVSTFDVATPVSSEERAVMAASAATAALRPEKSVMRLQSAS